MQTIMSSAVRNLITVLPSYWMRAVMLILFATLSIDRTHAGGGPSGIVVLYNPNDIRSVTLANAYQRGRDIPERNMVPYAFPASFTRTTGWDFIYSLRSTLEARGLDAQLQGFALVGIHPLNSAQRNPGDATSTASFLYLSPEFGQANYPVSSINNPAFIGRDLGVRSNTRALTANTEFSGKKIWPVSCLGYPGRSGGSLKDWLAIVRRAPQRDGVKPDGVIYWPLNSDVRSTTRSFQTQEVTELWQAMGIRHQIIGRPPTTGTAWVSGRSDIIGGIVGSAQPNPFAGNSYLPGAWVDHLTSFGATFDTFTPNQRLASDWLRAGADGSSGTMMEPFASSSKFPHAHIHTHFRNGASLMEAFWLSIEKPEESLPLGDPLLQPFADLPSVQISAPAEAAAVSGTILLSVNAEATGAKTLDPMLDLFVDGRRIHIGAPGESVTATRIAGGFSLDTTTLEDGWHELRVVAYNDDAVRSQAEHAVGVVFNNHAQSIALSGTSAVNPAAAANYTIIPTGLTDLTSVTLQANGRTLATTPATIPLAGGTVAVNAGQAPLDGEWKVSAVGRRGNGREVWSQPLTASIEWPAMAAAVNPPLGGVAADIRYFASTTVAGFNWDTTAPTTVTGFPGDPVNGLHITPTNIPGVTIVPSASAPGIQIDAWFYAPADDWYEVGFNPPTTFPTRAVWINDVPLPEVNSLFGVQRLEAGWHRLRTRWTVTNTTFASWNCRLRGGWSQDFVTIPRNALANTGGGGADLPSIASLHATPNPVTGTATTATLAANASIGDGTPGELATLTYTWSRISGPESVTFSANGNNAAQTTTATFTRAGSYVLALAVSGPAGSALSSTTVTVSPSQKDMQLDAGLATTLLAGQPLDLWAYSRDQLLDEMTVTPVNPALPTVQWTTSDANGTFTPLDSSGERVRFVSLTNVTGGRSITVTATGVNGRTGSASRTLTISPPQPVTRSRQFDFSISQFARSANTPVRANTPVIFERSFTLNSNNTNGIYPDSFQWSVIAAPPGQSLVLSANAGPVVSGTPSGPGLYTIQMVRKPLFGTSTTETRSFVYNTNGTITSGPNLNPPHDVTALVGGSVTLRHGFTTPAPFVLYQWQTSSDGGNTWTDVPGGTSFELTYGPVTPEDNGRKFRAVFTDPPGTSTSSPATLTVNSVNVASSPGEIGVIFGPDVFVASNRTGVVSESDGIARVIVRRTNGVKGAVGVTWNIFNFSGGRFGVDHNGVDGSAVGTLSWADGDSSDRILDISLLRNPAIANPEFDFTLSNLTGTNTFESGNRSREFIIRDSDGPGRAAFSTAAISSDDSKSSVTLSVRRLWSFVGPLTVNFSTPSAGADTAVPFEDYTPVSGSITWEDGDRTDKTIVIPLVGSNALRGSRKFTVTLSSSNATQLDTPSTATVTLGDSPWKLWQQKTFAGAIPTSPLWQQVRNAHLSNESRVLYRLDETTGTSISGVGPLGSVVSSGALTNTGAGSTTLGVDGPRPPVWPGLESVNTGLKFNASGATGSGASTAFNAGASIHVGTANGFGALIGKGFTISAFVKTTTTNRMMVLLGGQRTGTNTQISVSLNRAFNNTTTLVPHSLRLLLRGQGSSSTLEYSVTLADTPTGSLCDGNWHHIAIVVPELTSAFAIANEIYPRFYFDGNEWSPNNVRGTNSLTGSPTFADFDGSGLRIGAFGTSPPTMFFDGAVDELALLSAPLSSNRIAALAAARPAEAFPAFAADNASPAGDGVPNLLKYALGLSPTAPATSAALPGGGINGTFYDFGFTRLRDATDITYRVDRSTDLSPGSWQEVWNSTGNPYTSAAPSTLEVRSFDATEQDRSFYRLRVTRP